MFLEINNQIAILALRFGDLMSYANGDNKWEDAEIKKHQHGEHMVSEFFFIYGVGCLVENHASKLRMMSAACVSFQTVDTMPTSHPSFMMWRLPDDSAFSYHPETIKMFARVEYFLGAPAAVDKPELAVIQPAPESCKWLNDNSTDVCGALGGLDALLSKVALELDDTDLAAAHGKAGVAHHTNPFKSLYARFALALSLVNGGNAATPAQPESQAAIDQATSASSQLVESNPRLEQQHRRLLACLNKGNLEDFKQMITDNVKSIDPMGKERTGRDWVVKTMGKSMATFRGKFATDDEGVVKCELKTLSADETGARYVVNAMGMQMTVGDRVRWEEGGRIMTMRSRMNPPEGEW